MRSPASLASCCADTTMPRSPSAVEDGAAMAGTAAKRRMLRQASRAMDWLWRQTQSRRPGEGRDPPFSRTWLRQVGPGFRRDAGLGNARAHLLSEAVLIPVRRGIAPRFGS